MNNKSNITRVLTVVALGLFLSTTHVASTIAADAAPTPDMSNGADNFYKSDRVIMQKVTFENQYKMKVTGNLFIPKSTPDIQREFYDFYRTPRGEFTTEGQSPLLTTHPTLTSNVKFMNFYPLVGLETISSPMLFITGDNAHSREFSEEAYRLAGGQKELYIVPGAGHVDLYDRVDLIPFDKLESFFKENLKEE